MPTSAEMLTEVANRISPQHDCNEKTCADCTDRLSCEHRSSTQDALRFAFTRGYMIFTGKAAA